MTDPRTPEDQPSQMTKTKRINWARMGIFFSTLGIIIFICAFGFGYFALAKINITLAQMIAGVQQNNAANQNNIHNLQGSVGGLQQTSQKSQELITQQEKVMDDWRQAQKGNLEKWQVAEAQYLIKLANDHLQFAHDDIMALVLLERAQQILDNLSDTNLLEIRKTLANSITNLQAAPRVDTNALFVRLVALDNQIDKLPLPTNPLQPDTKSTSTANNVTTNQNESHLSWWKRGLNRTWESLSKIVIVHYNGSNKLPLVLPEEKVFLYQNLHAQFANAIWAVLHRNDTVYQTSLDQIAVWVKQYFAQDNQATQSMLQNLTALKENHVASQTVDLSPTLKLLDSYLAQPPVSQ